MADGHVIADQRRLVVGVDMDDGAVLNVAARADHDAVGVAAQHATIPDAGMRADPYVADQHRGRRDPGGGMDLRPEPLERVQNARAA